MTDLTNTSLDARIAAELENARTALTEKNDGKARACARRAAGIIIKEYLAVNQNSPAQSQSALERLKEVANNEQFPENIRKAARRLVTNVNDRLSPDFTLHPVHDADILIGYFKDLVK